MAAFKQQLPLFKTGDFTGFLVAVLAVLVVCVSRKRRRTGLAFPPGPPAWPLLGHLPLLGGRPHVRFSEWSRRYGPVLGVRLGPRQVVVLNDFESAREALVTKAEVFSSRPDLYLMRLFSNGGKVCWKAQRRVTDRALRRLGIGKVTFEGKVMREVDDLVSTMSDQHGGAFDPKYHVGVAVLNIICSLVFGEHFNHDDPLFLKLFDAFEDISHYGGSTKHLNIFPALRHVPVLNTGAVRTMAAVKKGREFISTMIGQHKATFDPSNIRDFIDAYLLAISKETDENSSSSPKKGENFLNEDELRQDIFDLFIAGTESTTTTILWALLLLSVHPEIQTKVQEELDSALGPYRDASVLDRPSLPYTEATILEVLRFRPTPFGLPHATTADTTLGGLEIPAETQVIINRWALSMDDRKWSHPDRFDPGRFLDPEGHLDVPVYFRPFLMGRRACVGAHLAKMELLLFLTSILRRFTIKPPEGAPAQSLDGHLGIILQPPSFQICAVPR
ncbi:PREDICTED: steroid 17-alpha-hydroxylase/17,20 lyase-like [Branchiostoma belcheri]|uniref:Steroid 17-alpha-hydroxylase/17,20 lyase-like n=1 Tax=Branchiostoma belcheri TaxID=7741 RepID=A0A6P4XS08_BRABE|nr:PREDICTED: steroid 17-alpha-hydroxylase/17,20 lyase-like [Branchiostoma belcheri]